MEGVKYNNRGVKDYTEAVIDHVFTERVTKLAALNLPRPPSKAMQ